MRWTGYRVMRSEVVISRSQCEYISYALSQLGGLAMSPGMATSSRPVPYAPQRLFHITWSQDQRMRYSEEVPLAKKLQFMHTQAWVSHLSHNARQLRPGPLVCLLCSWLQVQKGWSAFPSICLWSKSRTPQRLLTLPSSRLYVAIMIFHSYTLEDW